MAYPDNLLVTGERVVVNKRPHWKVLILPTILFILIIGGGVALSTWLHSKDLANQSIFDYIIIGVAVIALIVLVLVPFVRWRTEHFVITNHHVFFRTGLLSRREHQIPLGQIANMETEVTFWGRLMGYGSLIVESSADQPLKFRNVASLSKVQATLNQLIRDERERTHRGPDRPDPPAADYPPQAFAQPGYPPPGSPPYQGQPQQTYPQQGQQAGQPPQGYPQQGGQPPGYPQQQYTQQGYPPQGYQPTQAYQPPPGYPPSGAQPATGPIPTSTPTSTPSTESVQGEGRSAQQS